MTDPHLLVLSAALAVAMLGALLLYLAPGPCRCEKCGFHVNERRVAQARQKEIQHDAAHKGFGYKDGDRDVYRCKDAECDRNPTGPTER
jgi:hypothetical protein